MIKDKIKVTNILYQHFRNLTIINLRHQPGNDSGVTNFQIIVIVSFFGTVGCDKSYSWVLIASPISSFSNMIFYHVYSAKSLYNVTCIYFFKSADSDKVYFR